MYIFFSRWTSIHSAHLISRLRSDLEFRQSKYRKSIIMNIFHGLFQSTFKMDKCSLIVTLIFILMMTQFCVCDECIEKSTNITGGDKYRLPRNLFPELYKLTVFTHINDDEGFKYYGNVRITVWITLFFLFLSRYFMFEWGMRNEE